MLNKALFALGGIGSPYWLAVDRHFSSGLPVLANSPVHTTVDSLGNVFTVTHSYGFPGTFQSTTFRPTITKRNINGNVVVSRTLQKTINSQIITNSITTNDVIGGAGRLYLCGRSTDINTGETDAVIYCVGTNTLGIVWSRRYSLPGAAYTEFVDLRLDGGNLTVVTSPKYSTNPSDPTGSAIITYDTNGNLVSEFQLPDNNYVSSLPRGVEADCFGSTSGTLTRGIIGSTLVVGRQYKGTTPGVNYFTGGPIYDADSNVDDRYVALTPNPLNTSNSVALIYATNVTGLASKVFTGDSAAISLENGGAPTCFVVSSSSGTALSVVFAASNNPSLLNLSWANSIRIGIGGVSPNILKNPTIQEVFDGLVISGTVLTADGGASVVLKVPKDGSLRGIYDYSATEGVLFEYGNTFKENIFTASYSPGLNPDSQAYGAFYGSITGSSESAFFQNTGGTVQSANRIQVG